MRLRAAITLHRAVVISVIERHGLGEVPAVLRSGDPWLPPQAGADLSAAVDADLAEQGLLFGGRLRQDLEEALITVATPAAALYGWVGHTELGNYRLHLARDAADAAILDVESDEVTVRSVEPERGIAALIEQLPAHPEGVGRSYTFPESEAPWRTKDGYTADGKRACHDARLAANLLAEPRVGGAQFHGAGSDVWARHPVNILDFAEHGRWLIGSDDTHGDRYFTLAPATLRTLTTTLRRIVDPS